MIPSSTEQGILSLMGWCSAAATTTVTVTATTSTKVVEGGAGGGWKEDRLECTKWKGVETRKLRLAPLQLQLPA